MEEPTMRRDVLKTVLVGNRVEDDEARSEFGHGMKTLGQRCCVLHSRACIACLTGDALVPGTPHTSVKAQAVF